MEPGLSLHLLGLWTGATDTLFWEWLLSFMACMVLLHLKEINEAICTMNGIEGLDIVIHFELYYYYRFSWCEHYSVSTCSDLQQEPPC